MTEARPNRSDGGATAIESTKLLITPKPSVAGSSVLCRWNHWLMPDKKHASDLIMNLAKFSGILHFLQNLLLWTRPRFFARLEPNQCRKILWRVNINNYQKKLNFRFTVPKGRQNIRRGRATFSKMPVTPERNEISSPNSANLCKSSSWGRGDWPHGCAIRGKKHKNGCN